MTLCNFLYLFERKTDLRWNKSIFFQAISNMETEKKFLNKFFFFFFLNHTFQNLEENICSKIPTHPIINNKHVFHCYFHLKKNLKIVEERHPPPAKCDCAKRGKMSESKIFLIRQGWVLVWSQFNFYLFKCCIQNFKKKKKSKLFNDSIIFLNIRRNLILL